MPSAQYYIDQARTLLSWARASRDSVYAQALRKRAAEQLARINDARSAVPDLNPLLVDFNEQQIRQDSRPPGRT